jgi:acyl transferase domain-containing protein
MGLKKSDDVRQITHAAEESIAICGIACRFPKARNPNELFQLLLRGESTVSQIPEDRLKLMNGKSNRDPSLIDGHGSFFPQVDGFDANYFRISPVEAAMMDPQQRISLEVSAEALFDAGLTREELRTNRVGVYVGCHQSEYFSHLSSYDICPNAFASIGASRSGIAGQISYTWGLQGPSLVIDSDRSSSLVAVHLACSALLAKEIDVALVGGTNLLLDGLNGASLKHAGVLSSDGKIKFGDSSADGIARGEGFVFVVLRRANKSFITREQIYCTIAASSVNHNGNLMSDLMTSNPRAQEALLRSAYSDREFSENLLYIEAHGTGTAVGDKAELNALGQALGQYRPADKPLYVGSVKTNLGHTESAGGLASLIKLALSLKNGVIPGAINYREPNPEVDFAKYNMMILDKNLQIPKDDRPVFVGVSSFGLTGTNAHVILRKWDASESVEKATAPQLIFLSSHHEEGLKAAATDLLEQNKDQSKSVSLVDLSYTSQRRRDFGIYRACFVAKSGDELNSQLETFLNLEESRQAYWAQNFPDEKQKLVFVFAGTGGQWLQMAKGLFESSLSFRKNIETCSDLAQKITGWSVVNLLYESNDSGWTQEFDKVQVLLTAVNISLFKLYDEIGIKPSLVVGHSFGEIAAAYCGGYLSLEDAMKVVVHRSRLMKQFMGKGMMGVLELSVDAVLARISSYKEKVSIGAVNSHRSTVITGEIEAVSEILRQAELDGIFAKPVKSLLAGHSAQMDLIRDEFLESIKDVKALRGEIPFLSTVNLKFASDQELNPEYWYQNIRKQVNFSQAIDQIVKQGYQYFVECSPHPVLSSPIKDQLELTNKSGFVFPTLRKEEDDRAEFLATIGRLWAHGLPIKLEKFDSGGKVTSLPFGAWNQKRFWYTQLESMTSSQKSATSEIVPSFRARGNDRPDVSTDLNEGRSANQAKKSLTPLKFKLSEAINQVERNQIFVEFLSRQMAKALGLSSPELVNQELPFREMGLKSIMITELASKISSATDLRITSSTFFNYSTIQKLAAHLNESMNLNESNRSADQVSEMATKPTSHIDNSAVEGKTEPDDAIAIIAASCRFPGGVEDFQAFWKILANGEDSVTEVPSDRWSPEKYYHTDLSVAGTMNTRWGGFVRDVKKFDAKFFGISRREAEKMDPQQRILLEVVVEGLESANQPLEKVAGSKTGIFLGMSNTNDYTLMKTKYLSENALDGLDATGNANSIAAGRISYFLGLRGPAITVDTACSSSLVAVHLACQSLKSEESEMAIAAGVNLILTPENTITYAKNRMMSPEGRCKTFDSRADGYVRGEGCGVLILKKLSKAKADGDQVLGVILGSAVNQDGRSTGLTAPNGLAQKELYLEALKRAKIKPHQVSYVEAHGTGTPLGDPIEASSLYDVYGKGRVGKNPLFLGSVKTNIGHLEAAAGIAGLIKVLAQFKSGQFAPHLHFEKWNPQIQLPASEIQLPIDRWAWAPVEGDRIAAVSSFGFSGTNAHVIVKELASKETVSSPLAQSTAPRLVLISAKSEAALRALAAKYAEFLEKSADVSLVDFAYTCASGRSHWNYRAAFVASSLHSARQVLRAQNQQRSWLQGIVSSKPQKFAIYLSNSGAELNPGLPELFQNSNIFRQNLQQLDLKIRDRFGFSVVNQLVDASTSSISPTDEVQNSLKSFSIQFSLAKMLLDLGVYPQLLVAEGEGEWVAACLADIISVESVFDLIAAKHLGGKIQDVHFAVNAASFKIFSVNKQMVLEKTDLSSEDYWKSVSTFHQSVKNALGDQDVSVVIALGRPAISIADEKRLLINLREGQSYSDFLSCICQLYVMGAQLAWTEICDKFSSFKGRKIQIPSYAFQRESFWIDDIDGTLKRSELEPRRQIQRSNLSYSSNRENSFRFEVRVSAQEPRYLSDHKVHGTIVVPAVFYLQYVLDAARSALKGNSTQIVDVVIREALVIKEGAPEPRLELILEMAGSEGYEFTISSKAEGASEITPRIHMTGKVVPSADLKSPTNINVRAESVKTQAGHSLERSQFYRSLSTKGLQFGSCFQTIGKMWSSKGEALAELETPRELVDYVDHFDVHPCLVDTGLHLIAHEASKEASTYIPITIESFVIRSRGAGPLRCFVELNEGSNPNGEIVSGSFVLLDRDGKVVCEARGAQFKKASRASVLRALGNKEVEHFYRLNWSPASRPVVSEVKAHDWLIVCESSTNTSLAAERIRRANSQVKVVDLDAHDESLKAIESWLTGSGSKRIIFINSDGFDIESAELESNFKKQLTRYDLLLQTVQKVAKSTIAGLKVWFLNQGTRPSGLWGFAKSLNLEASDRYAGFVQITEKFNEDNVEALMSILRVDQFGEFSIRGRDVFGPAIDRASLSPVLPIEDLVSSDGVYLITGGLGALGLLTTKFLVAKGAKEIILMSRSKPSSEAQEYLLELKSKGIRVALAHIDVADHLALRDFFAVNSLGEKLKGVVHAAGVSEDSILMTQNFEKFDKVFRGKVLGAFNLHQLTKQIPLKFFVMYSSTASYFGNEGQINYSTANSYLDSLASYRAAAGLPGKSIAWGAWGEVGMWARMSESHKEVGWSRLGMSGLTTDEGLNGLEKALVSAVDNVSIFKMDWERYKKAERNPHQVNLIRRLVPDQPKVAKSEIPGEDNFVQQLAKVPSAQRKDFLKQKITETLARVLKSSVDRSLPEDTPFTELGLDSVMALELRNQLNKALQSSFPATLAFTFPTLEALTNYALKEIDVGTTQQTSAPVPQTNKVKKEAQQTSSLKTRSSLEDIEALVRGTLSRILKSDASDLPGGAVFSELGLDSVMAVDLRNSLQKELGLGLPATIAYTYPSVNQMSDHLASLFLQQDSQTSNPLVELRQVPLPERAPKANPKSEPAIEFSVKAKVDEIHQLSDAEALMRLFEKKAS